ncbi:MAG: sugar ABC transporter permease [Propionibacteriaceae bacterium]|nr:sugar ABC transporter permease [Propionibacteriaceae bacterium]
MSLKETMGGSLRQYGIMLVLVGVVVIAALATGGKLVVPNNVFTLILQNSYVLILAIGMVMVIVAGHIDLSVGSVVAFIGGVIGWMTINWGFPWPVAVLAALAIGVIIGAWHGFWVAYVRIPAFIVTLAGMLIFRGLALIIVGTTLAGFDQGFINIAAGSLPPWFGFIGDFDVVTLVIGVIGVVGLVVSTLRSRASQIKHGIAPEAFGFMIGKLIVISIAILVVAGNLALSDKGTPFLLLIVGALIFIYSFVLNKTVFGRHIYAIGGNLNAAILSGINTAKTNFMIFVHMGLLAAVAAIVVTSRAGAATAQVGQQYEMDAIAACFIGGTAVTGGVGRISGAMIGALIMGVLNMSLSIAGVSSDVQQTVKGVVVLAAVALDLLSKRRAKVA